MRQRKQQTSCSVSSMPRSGLSLTPASTIEAEAVPAATRTSLVGRCRPGAVQSVCPDVQVSTHMAPGYLSTLYQPVSGVPGRRHLRSAGRGELDFPRVNLSTYGGRRLPTPVLHPGTRCLTISRTLSFPFNLSNVILRHSSFPHTSTPQRV